MTGVIRCTGGEGWGVHVYLVGGINPKIGGISQLIYRALSDPPEKGLQGDLALCHVSATSRKTVQRMVGWDILCPWGLMDKSILLCTSSGLQDKANSALCHGASSITCDTIHARRMLYGDKYHLIWKDDFRIAWFQKKRTVSMSQLQTSRVLSWIFGGKKVNLSGEA